MNNTTTTTTTTTTSNNSSNQVTTSSSTITCAGNTQGQEGADRDMAHHHSSSSKPVMPVVMVEGVAQPAIFQTNRPLPEHVRCLKAMEMRGEDVVVLAYTKAGTHWFWEMATMLMSGKAQYERRAKENLMLEATPIEVIDAEPSPRVLNSHLPIRLLPHQIVEKKVKVVHVYRNIKDVFVSMFFHYKQIPGADHLTLENFESSFFSEDLPTGNYFGYLKQMDEFVKQHPDHPVFSSSYEDTKEDPVQAVERLAQFLGVKASPQLCQDIAEATSFAKLKEADQTKAQSHLPPTNYYRKGEVGDWKNYLTVAQSERFDAAMTQLTSSNFRFRYSL